MRRSFGRRATGGIRAWSASWPLASRKTQIAHPLLSDSKRVGKGSGRSVSGVDLGAAIQRLAMDGLIEKGGGHKMAAGLTLTRDQLEPAMARLSELLAKQGADARGPVELRCDAAVMPAGATVDLIEQLDRLVLWCQRARTPVCAPIRTRWFCQACRRNAPKGDIAR